METFDGDWPNKAEDKWGNPPNVPPPGQFVAAWLVWPRWRRTHFDVVPRDVAQEGWRDGGPEQHGTPDGWKHMCVILSVDGSGIYVAARLLMPVFHGAIFAPVALDEFLTRVGGIVCTEHETALFSLATGIRVVAVDARGTILN